MGFTRAGGRGLPHVLVSLTWLHPLQDSLLSCLIPQQLCFQLPGAAGRAAS